MPFFETPGCARCGRSSSSRSSRPQTSKTTGRSTEPGDQGSRRRRQASTQRGAGATASILAPPKDYEGIRLGPYKYIAWPDGEKELYDLEKDPYELNNIVRIPNYFPVRNYLHRELRDLENCVGRTCREEAPESR